MSNDYDKNSLLENLEKLPVVAIGPFTADELKKFNVKNTIAQVHTVSGAFDTIKNIFSAA
jgi:uroporphyrinogen-III synthase